MRCSLGVPIFLVLSCLPLHAQEQEQANSPRRGPPMTLAEMRRSLASRRERLTLARADKTLT